jgi:threonine aldolase
VEELETTFAVLLGKESSVFMPTGTLANHMAVRKLAGENRRVIVQELSHFYNDSGDGAQTLSNLNLIPLGQGSIEIKPDELDYIIKKTKSGRVELKIGAMSIETPVRRLQDRMYSDENLASIIDLARANGIKLHLDGARLFVQSAHTNTSPASYGKQFDTVYTSLWKCFNAPSGAVLAGSKSFTSNLYHERRMFGGSLPAAWPYAAIALYYAHDFIAEYKKALNIAETVFSSLVQNDRVSITRFDGGSHIVKMTIKGADTSRFKSIMIKKGIELNDGIGDTVMLKINPTLNRLNSDEILMRFKAGLKEI